MEPSTRQTKLLTAFVVCDPGSDIKILLSVLRDLGLKPLNATDTLGRADLVVTSTQTLIAEADLVCAILQDETSAGTYFEVGYAVGTGQPIILIGDPPSWPASLADYFWIRAAPNDRSALQFQIRVFLDNLRGRHPKRLKSTTKVPERRTKPSSRVNVAAFHSALESRLAESLNRSPEVEAVVAQPPKTGIERYVPDFAIWLASSLPSLGGPAIVEVKGTALSDAALAETIERVTSYALASGSQSAIILAPRAGSGRKHPVVSLSPQIFFYDLDDFIDKLESRVLIDTLRQDRNRFAHSAD